MAEWYLWKEPPIGWYYVDQNEEWFPRNVSKDIIGLGKHGEEQSENDLWIQPKSVSLWNKPSITRRS